MGVSTDAILFYGYCWTEEDDLFIDVEWTDILLKSRGVVNPWDACPEFPSSPGERWEQKKAREDAWVYEHRVEIDAWYAAKKSVEAEFGNLIVGTHCSDECPMPYVATVEICASRGSPEIITSLEVDPSWDGKLNRWMDALKVPKPNERPWWWLAPYWG